MASTVRLAIAAFVLLHLYLYLAQDSMIFFPQPLDDDMRARVTKRQPRAEEIMLATADGHRLQGWFVRSAAGSGDAPVLIYFGGNAEEVSGFTMEARELPGISLALFNYRGYGRSDGVPSEQALFADAVTIYDAIAVRPGVDRKHIIAMGRSLGSGVATHLATRRPLSAVVLVTPYDSIAAVARAKYPFALVDVLLKHPFDSLALAPKIAVPMLALIAERDSVIAPAHAMTLLKAWRGPVTPVVIERADHNDISSHPRYWPAVRDFLRN